jgi:hypothetical protein
MTGHSRVIVTPRDLHLFRESTTAKLVDRDMVRSIAGIRSINSANERLVALHRAGLLRRYFIGTEAGGRKALYTLSPKSAALIGHKSFWKFQRPENQVLVGDAFVAHQSAVNWVWIAAKYKTTPDMEFLRWLSFDSPISAGIPLGPDGYAEFKKDGAVYPVFFEIDLGTETSRVWQRKVALYLKLAGSGEFQEIFKQPRFRVAVVTVSDLRLRNLRKLVAKSTTRIFFFLNLDTITEQGLNVPLWLRPEGEGRVPLL